MKAPKSYIRFFLITLISLFIFSVSNAGSEVRAVVANPAPFKIGDVFASISDGLIRHYGANGELLETLDTRLGSGISTTGCGFDPVGNLYVTTFNGGLVKRFAGPDDPHTLLDPNPSDSFGSGYSGSPESIVFDSLGNVYVGSVDGDNDIRKFDGAGNPLARFDVATERRGSDWIELSADQKTMFYTSEGRRIFRYDVSGSGSQLSDFVVLPGSGVAYALRLLPPGDGSGGLLVADTSNIKRLDGSGKVVQTYDVSGEDSWFSLNLDPDGTSFWAGNINTGKFYKFDINTAGGPLLIVDTGVGSEKLYGICVFREITVGRKDSDGDGLLDDWERNGIPGADLPAMGADVNIKDVFVQLDWMEDSEHNLKPDPKAIEEIVKSFANSGVDGGKGIRLHVDMGPDSTDFVTRKPWGSLGKGHQIDFVDVLGRTSLDQEVTALLQDGKPRQSDLVFHYAFFVNKYYLASQNTTGSTGVSFGGKQVFLVSMGASLGGKMSFNEQAGTFMHELGHNLGLCHGGPVTLVNSKQECEANYKPNYLSVMNYSFQTSGLLVEKDEKLQDSHFDYSRFGNIPDLDEAKLSEKNGISGGSQIDTYGTKYSIGFPYLCFPNTIITVGEDVKFLNIAKKANGPIDWNCNKVVGVLTDADTVQADVNAGDTDANGKNNDDLLRSFDDWTNLSYEWGNIGLGISRPPVTITPEDVADSPVEITPEQDLRVPRISEPRVQLIKTVAPTTAQPNSAATYKITMSNTDASDAEGVVITDILPAGFSYQTGSTSGATTSDPTIDGQSLAWGPFVIPANGGSLALSFRATTASAPGIYPNNVLGSSTNGVVIPTGDTAVVEIGAPMPDLVIQQIVATGDNVQVVIQNQGIAAVPQDNGFWVDVYIDPSAVPTRPNQIWNFLADEGLVWGVDGDVLPMEPGEVITLTLGDALYWPDLSKFSGSLPPGTPVYVQVDSANTNTTYGGVLESHEASGGAYNNVAGPIPVEAAAARQTFYLPLLTTEGTAGAAEVSEPTGEPEPEIHMLPSRVQPGMEN